MANRVMPHKTADGKECYLAYDPDLPGCVAHGDTKTEAMQNLEDAREAYKKVKTRHDPHP